MNALLDLDLNILRKSQVIDWAYTEEDQTLTQKQYDEWVNRGLHGPLNYMSDHRKDLRSKISHFYPEFQSALVFLFDYKNAAKSNLVNNNYQFAAYTKGFDDQDYHYWIAEKLNYFASILKLQNYRLSIDAQPVLERDLAYRAGLGWFGKNSMLINQKEGSFFLIASILLDQKLNLDKKEIVSDHCGTCTRCIDACPTQAIIENKVIDANKCISTFTIELFQEASAPKGYPTSRGEIFGCDICQEVCPWNTKPLQVAEMKTPSQFQEKFNSLNLETISNREFRRQFKGTSLERTGRVGLLKNLKLVKN